MQSGVVVEAPYQSGLRYLQQTRITSPSNLRRPSPFPNRQARGIRPQIPGGVGFCLGEITLGAETGVPNTAPRIPLSGWDLISPFPVVIESRKASDLFADALSSFHNKFYSNISIITRVIPYSKLPKPSSSIF